MAIQPIGTNHKATNLAILSYQIDVHSTYSVEKAPWKVTGVKIRKCCCDPFKIHKKKVRNNLFSRTPMGKFLTPIGKFFPAQHFGVDSIPFLVPSSSLDGLCRALVTPNCS